MASKDRSGLSSESHDERTAADARILRAQTEALQCKEKFFVLRDRFEQVTAIRRHHESALETAQSKVKDLQAECDMLLDAIALQVPSQPSLVHYLEHMPPATTTSYPSTMLPPAPLRPPFQPYHPQTSSSIYAPPNGVWGPPTHVPPSQAPHHAPLPNGHAHSPHTPTRSTHVPRTDAR